MTNSEDKLIITIDGVNYTGSVIVNERGERVAVIENEDLAKTVLESTAKPFAFDVDYRWPHNNVFTPDEGMVGSTKLKGFITKARGHIGTVIGDLQNKQQTIAGTWNCNGGITDIYTSPGIPPNLPERRSLPVHFTADEIAKDDIIGENKIKSLALTGGKLTIGFDRLKMVDNSRYEVAVYSLAPVEDKFPVTAYENFIEASKDIQVPLNGEVKLTKFEWRSSQNELRLTVTPDTGTTTDGNKLRIDFLDANGNPATETQELSSNVTTFKSSALLARIAQAETDNQLWEMDLQLLESDGTTSLMETTKKVVKYNLRRESDVTLFSSDDPFLLTWIETYRAKETDLGIEVRRVETTPVESAHVDYQRTGDSVAVDVALGDFTIEAIVSTDAVTEIELKAPVAHSIATYELSIGVGSGQVFVMQPHASGSKFTSTDPALISAMKTLVDAEGTVNFTIANREVLVSTTEVRLDYFGIEMLGRELTMRWQGGEDKCVVEAMKGGFYAPYLPQLGEWIKTLPNGRPVNIRLYWNGDSKYGRYHEYLSMAPNSDEIVKQNYPEIPGDTSLSEDTFTTFVARENGNVVMACNSLIHADKYRLTFKDFETFDYKVAGIPEEGYSFDYNTNDNDTNEVNHKLTEILRGSRNKFMAFKLERDYFYNYTFNMNVVDNDITWDADDVDAAAGFDHMPTSDTWAGLSRDGDQPSAVTYTPLAMGQQNTIDRALDHNHRIRKVQLESEGNVQFIMAFSSYTAGRKLVVRYFVDDEWFQAIGITNGTDGEVNIGDSSFVEYYKANLGKEIRLGIHMANSGNAPITTPYREYLAAVKEIRLKKDKSAGKIYLNETALSALGREFSMEVETISRRGYPMFLRLPVETSRLNALPVIDLTKLKTGNLSSESFLDVLVDNAVAGKPIKFNIVTPSQEGKQPQVFAKGTDDGTNIVIDADQAGSRLITARLGQAPKVVKSIVLEKGTDVVTFKL